MKTIRTMLAGILLGTALASALQAQPILNRVEQLLREQLDTVRSATGARPAAEPGYLGLFADDRQEEGRGVRVTSVVVGGPAARGGLQPGDLITTINGQAITGPDDIARVLDGKAPGAVLTISINRAGTVSEQTVTLGRRGDTQPNGPVREDLPSPLPGPADAAAPQGRRLGIRTVPVTAEAQQANRLQDASGAAVVAVSDNSPAARAGIPVGAVITAIDGSKVDTPETLAAAMRRTNANSVEVAYVFQGQDARARVSFVSAALPTDAPKLELRGRPVAAAEPEKAGGPDLIPGSDERTAALEARVRELELKVEKLEAALARDSK